MAALLSLNETYLNQLVLTFLCQFFLSSTTICTSFPVTIPTVTTALMQPHNIDIVEPDCKDYYYFICAKITLSTYKFLKQKVLSLALVRYGLVYTNW